MFTDIATCMSAVQVTPGGELAFIRKMVAESFKLRTRVLWYSSMVGKRSSLVQLERELRDAGVPTLRTTALVQGRTRRWAIAWSFFPATDFLSSGFAFSALDAAAEPAAALVAPSSSLSSSSSSASSAWLDAPAEDGTGGDADVFPGSVAAAGGASAAAVSGSKRPRPDDDPASSDADRPSARRWTMPLGEPLSLAATGTVHVHPCGVGAAALVCTTGGQALELPSDGAAPVALRDVVARLHEALAAPAGEHGGKPLVCAWMPALRAFVDTRRAGELTAACVMGCVLRIGTAAAPSPLFRFQVSVDVPDDAPASVASTSSSTASIEATASITCVQLCLADKAAHQAFDRFVDRLRGDTLRTSRKWRRKAQLQQAGAAGGEQAGAESTATTA